MVIPEGILCSKTHEWILEENDLVTVGLTDWAVEQLGDIVFVELPETGANFSKGEAFSTIESVKAASEIYAPISGEVVEVNEKLINSPELINEDCYSSWLIKLKPANLKEDSQGLLDYNDYKDEIE